MTDLISQRSTVSKATSRISLPPAGNFRESQIPSSRQLAKRRALASATYGKAIAGYGGFVAAKDSGNIHGQCHRDTMEQSDRAANLWRACHELMPVPVWAHGGRVPSGFRLTSNRTIVPLRSSDTRSHLPLVDPSRWSQMPGRVAGIASPAPDDHAGLTL